METNAVARAKITRFNALQWEEADDGLAVEEPLEIQMAWEEAGAKTQKIITVTMRTPGNDAELAAGFLFTEGIIQHTQEMALPEHLAFDVNRMLVTLNAHAKPSLQKIDRNFYTTSSCGVCGKTSIDALITVSPYKQEEDQICVEAGLLYGLQQVLKGHQSVFDITGGLHASALFDLQGRFVMSREDVGRHNALDKIIGAAFLNGSLPLNNVILLLSGRASFELLQKAAMAGIKLVAAVGAPSSLAVELAKASGITLVGFLRNERFNIYTGNQRIRL